MSTRDVNLLNIGLMLLSAFLAWTNPVELLLFAYAILGPLHYLTEISWLHDRQWFSGSKRDWILPCVISVALTLAYVAIESWNQREALSVEPVVLGFKVKGGWLAYLMLVAIAASLAAAFARGAGRRSLVVAAVFLAGFVLLQSVSGQVLVNVFLTTIIHVYVFTSCFILYGALKSRSTSGYASWVVHLALGALLLSTWSTEGIVIPGMAIGRLDVFVPVVHGVNYFFSRAGGGPEGRAPFVACMRFLAFAYTYHYLNWFSKTGIIRWHAVSRPRLIALVAIWIASLALYAWDWRWGFVALLALSLAHVLLEFPLNWKTFVGIGAELKARVAPSRRGTALAP